MTYYDLFELPRTASAEDIKKAFRREIAKYHPDKVQHLGREFQEIAVTKAAELTQAYKTLTDPAARADYDTTLDDGEAAPASSAAVASTEASRGPSAPDATPRPAEHRRYTPPDSQAPQGPPGGVFSAERAGARDLVHRAAVARFRKALEGELRCAVGSAAGFDFMCLPDKRMLWSKTPPQILGRFVPQVDGPAITETWALAVKARKDAQQRDLCVFVMGPSMSPAGELAMAITAQRRKPLPAGVRPLVLIPVNTQTWHAHIPTDAPPVVKSLLTRLKSS